MTTTEEYRSSNVRHSGCYAKSKSWQGFWAGAGSISPAVIVPSEHSTVNCRGVEEMSLSPQERAEFVNSYTRALITAWSSEEFSNQLSQDPRGALADVGITIPEGASLDVVRAIPDGKRDGSVDIQVGLYEEGLNTGHFEIRIPEVPQVDTAELTDSELEGVAAGDINCCCCPCCCCT
jgi:hypothetical protein